MIRLLRNPALQAICLISMVAMMGGSVVAPALPLIRETFDIPVASIGLLMAAFSLPGIFVIPITGVLADRYGRKRVILPLLFLYGVAGGLGGLAPNFETLLALRFLAGLGAGSLGVLTIVLIGDLFEGQARAAALGYRISAGQGANAIFPLIGGAVAVFGWQFPFLLFFFAIPVGIFALFALDAGGPRPIMPIRVYLRQLWQGITNRRVTGLLTVAPALMIVNQGIILTFIPILMEFNFSASAAVIGIILSVRVSSGAVAAAQTGWLATTIGLERLVVGAFVVLAAGIVMTPFMSGVWWLIAPAVLLGLSTGIAFPAFQTLLVGAASEEMRAAVISANGVGNRIGQALGPVLAGLIFTLGGIDSVFFSGAVFILAMSAYLAYALGIKKPG